MRSAPAPPTALSIRVFAAIPILLVMPSQLENVIGFRLIVDDVENPDRSRQLLVPLSHKVRTGLRSTVKSKNSLREPVILQLNPKVCPPDRGVDVGRP